MARKERFGYLEYSTVGCPCCSADYVFRDDKLFLILDDDYFLFPTAHKRKDGIYQCFECGTTFILENGETRPINLIELVELKKYEEENKLALQNKNKHKFLRIFKKNKNSISNESQMGE